MQFRMWRPVLATGAVVALVGVAAPMLASQPPKQGNHLHAVIDDRVLAVHQGDAHVIVQKNGVGAEAAIERLGGHVTRDLTIIDGFAATVPAVSVSKLGAISGVKAITLDVKLHPQGLLGGGSASSSSPLKSVYPSEVRADDLWKNGVTGQGVTVALVDTGVANVADLSGRVVPVHDDLDLLNPSKPCENLSGEATCDDTFGHGTFIAGIIAGNGAASNGAWKGIAPAAKLVSVKVAGADGSADVSNVLAAIQWVVSFKDRYGIRVLNLSLGTDSSQSYRVDPLNFAVEKAWDAGIDVVVAASNQGPAPGTISKPGDDPLVITAGAVDDMGTPGLGDDQLPDFSSHGPTAADSLAKPDLAAPGAHIVSLRAPGSSIDTQFPNYVDGSYRKGSGTSMATGVVSGAVALMLQAQPTWQPNRVKYALTATARAAASNDPMAVGSGVADAYDALRAPAGNANQGVTRSNGLGSLDLSRGSVRVALDDPLGTVLSGTETAQLLLWNPLVYTTTIWSPLTWDVTNFAGSRWYGSRWYSDPDGSRWYGSRWYGQLDGSRWYGSRWYGSRWYGAWE